MPLNPGERLQGRYQIEALLGQGGMGAVYRASDLALNVQVALKENRLASAEAERQFSREARILAGLRHPNLPRVTDHFVIPGQGQYLVMDYIEGESLRELITRRGALPEAEAVAWIKQVLDALQYLHSENVLHRDAKPANVKITPGGQVFLVDFGLAKRHAPDETTTMGARGVSPGYAPPEQYGYGRTDQRTDLYSVGATLYALLTGQDPPDALERMLGRTKLVPPSKVGRAISEPVEAALLRAMELRPEDRFQTAAEFVAMLSKPARQVVAPRPPGRAPGVQRLVAADPPGSGPQNRWLLPLVVGVVLIGLSVLILALVLGKGTGEARPTSLPTPLAPTLDVASPTSPQVVADTPALPPPTDPPTLAPPPTEPRAVSLPDLFQPGVRIDEQAVGSLYTGPQSRVIASIGPDRVLATRTRQGQEFSDTSLLQSRHYLGNDGSAPWLPFDVVDELLAGQRPAFGISSEEPDGTLELRGTSDYGVLIDGKLVTVPALEVHSSQGDVYTVLNDPGNRYVLRFEGGPGASGYDRYVTAFATEGAGLPPTAEPVRLFEVVYPGSDGVSLRAGPDVSQTELAVLSLGTRLSAEGAPVRGSGAVVWWPVSTAAQRGWVAEVYNNWRLIKPVMAAGDWVVVANPDETGNINLRDDGCQAVAILSRGTRLTVTGEGEVKCDDPSAGIVSEGRRWWPVRSSLSEEGWVADFSSDNKRTLVAPEWYAELVAQLP